MQVASKEAGHPSYLRQWSESQGPEASHPFSSPSWTTAASPNSSTLGKTQVKNHAGWQWKEYH